MSPNELRQIFHSPPPESEEIFAAYQTASQFYREVQSRTALKNYCEWYYTTSQRHRQELQQMRGELNIMSWFRSRRA